MSSINLGPAITTGGTAQTVSGDGVVVGLDAGMLVGFYGDTGSAQQTIAAAGSDAATTQALANSIRTILINLGIAV